MRRSSAPKGFAACLAVVLCVVAALGTPLARAQEPAPTPSELGLTVTAGYGGRPSQAEWMPVEVRLEPRRPLAGTLEVASQLHRGESGVTREVRSVEVGAGSAKVYRFLVPKGPLNVVLAEPGRQPFGLRVRDAGADGGYLAGMLGALPGGIAGGLPPLRVEPLGSNGTWVPVDPVWVELSPAALAPLGGLVADLGALAALPQKARQNLAVAVASGTDLVVVAPDAGPVDLPGLGLPWSPVTGIAPPQPGTAPVSTVLPIPAAWVIDEAGVPVAAAVPAGRGRVSVVSVAPGSDGPGRSTALWSTLLGPAPRVNASSGEWAIERTPWQFGRLFQDGDATAPVVPWLAAFILVYVLVVGPVNGIVLARFRRRELAWVTVPLVTVIFAASAFIGARGASPLLSVGARLTWWIDGVGADVVAVGVRGPAEGAHQVALPGHEWTAQAMVESGRDATLVADDDHRRVQMDLRALQLGGVLASRPTQAAAPLALDAVARPGGVEVTVRNTSSQAIEQVILRAATARTGLGPLAPGESRTATVGRAGVLPRDPYQQAFDTVEPGPNGVVEPPASLEALLRTYLIDGSPGMVWAIGQTGGSPPGIQGVGGTPPGIQGVGGTPPT
ncbi:MAG: hypothetical protein ACRDZO_07425, partial [Egibacteraceae bacterium]